MSGNLIALSETTATLQVGGVFYDLMIPSGLHQVLKPSLKSETPITLHTIYYIEAGDMKSAHYPRLVGFTDAIDKEFFQLFTSVPGLGIKKALKSLILPISEIARSIEEKSSAGLSRLPGVGPRLAEKIIAELAGKTAKYALAQDSRPLVSKAPEGDYFDETLQALMQLQYSRIEAEEMLRSVLAQKPKVKSAEELIALVFAASLSTS